MYYNYIIIIIVIFFNGHFSPSHVWTGITKVRYHKHTSRGRQSSQNPFILNWDVIKPAPAEIHMHAAAGA